MHKLIDEIKKTSDDMACLCGAKQTLNDVQLRAIADNFNGTKDETLFE